MRAHGRALVRRLLCLISPFLLVVLEAGCTTNVINLAIGDGGTEFVNAARPDASTDDLATTNEDAKRDVNEDAKEAPITDASGDAFDEAFQKALDEGAVAGPGHYVQFRCCDNSGSCTAEVLGGPDACFDGKMRAIDRCNALGSNAVAYASYGACTTLSAP